MSRLVAHAPEILEALRGLDSAVSAPSPRLDPRLRELAVLQLAKVLNGVRG